MKRDKRKNRSFHFGQDDCKHKEIGTLLSGLLNDLNTHKKDVWHLAGQQDAKYSCI